MSIAAEIPVAVGRQYFREWGRIMDGKPDQLLEDAMIAATARVHQLIVATRNEDNFRQLDVQMVTPFKAG